MVHGANGSNIGYVSGTGAEITDNHFTSNITAITSRDQKHGSMIGNSVIGVISGNTLLNGPVMGIGVSHQSARHIHGNAIV